jgi:hypothetical protein
MNAELFRGKLVRLGIDNPEELAKDFARWRRDSEYTRLLDSDPMRLFSPQAFQKDFEANLEKKPFDDFLFSIHILADDRRIGFLWLGGFDWNHGNGWVGIGLGEREVWGKGFGTDAMQVGLSYAFTELNLHRVTLMVFSYNPRAIRSYEKAGFRQEGFFRQSVLRDGRRTDDVWMGILRDDWLRLQEGAE